MYKFEIYRDAADEFRVRFKYNAEVIFVTEGYTSKQSAQNAIKALTDNAATTIVEDIS